MHQAKCASLCGVLHTIVCPLDSNYSGDMSQQLLLVYIVLWRRVLNTHCFSALSLGMCGKK
jgi:hypothetical protein